MRRYRVANMLGQRLEKLITVIAFDKDDAVARILAFLPDCDKDQLDFIDQIGLKDFVGILGIDIPVHKDIHEIHLADLREIESKKTLH
jgi:hypothetical protein